MPKRSIVGRLFHSFGPQAKGVNAGFLVGASELTRLGGAH
jgi:hypothetical protein